MGLSFLIFSIVYYLGYEGLQVLGDHLCLLLTTGTHLLYEQGGPKGGAGGHLDLCRDS